MSRQRPVLQTFWHVEPAESVLVKNERRIPGNRITSSCTLVRLVLGSFPFYKSGNVYAGPFFRVPPHQFFPFAPRTAVRPRTGTIVNDSPIARPTEAPAVAEIVPGSSRVCLVHAIAAKNARINPAAACGGSVGFQFREAVRLWAMMRFAIAIDATKQHAITIAAVSDAGYRFSLPTVNLGEHGFHVRIAQFIFRIPPVERAQRLVDWLISLFYFRFQAQRQLMNEPCVGATIPGRIDGFFTPLQQALCVGECAFLFSVTGGGEKENFRLDVLGLQHAALDLGRFTPEICRFDLDHVAHD